ncbi:MAG: hypothetical protein QNJ61_11380 [Desulfobacterales bacterium]|nr:hypothetical protein [Desulfobacterales bacterium]
MTKYSLENKLKIYDRFIATITAIGVVGGGLWGAYTFFKQQKQSIKLRQRELAFMVYKDKKDAYLSLVDAANEITASKNRKEVIEKASLYLRLYYGRAHVIADSDHKVSESKIAFKNKLMTYLKDEQIDTSPFEYFGGVAFAITNSCKIYLDPRAIDELK